MGEHASTSALPTSNSPYPSCLGWRFGGPGGDRTHDLRIKSPLLYQLSYRPNSGQANS